MNTHTPGPWHIGIRPGPIVYGQQGEQVANLRLPMVGADENRANARLIAAAPELMELLETAVLRIAMANAEGVPILSAWLPEAQAAIARARGQA